MADTSAKGAHPLEALYQAFRQLNRSASFYEAMRNWGSVETPLPFCEMTVASLADGAPLKVGLDLAKLNVAPGELAQLLGPSMQQQAQEFDQCLRNIQALIQQLLDSRTPPPPTT